MYENRRPNNISHLSFSSFSNIVANFVFDQLNLALFVFAGVAFRVFGWVLDIMIVQPFNGVYIGQSNERPCWCFKVRVELFYEGRGSRVGKKSVNRFANLDEGSGLRRHYKTLVTDNFLYMSHKIIKSCKPDLSLQVSVLAKMASGVAK